MGEVLQITRPAYNHMIRYSTLCAPLEACGLGVTGERRANETKDLVQEIVPILNVAANPERAYVMSGEQQVMTMNWVDATRRKIPMVFHAHTEDPALLSGLDLECARDLDPIYVVVSLLEPVSVRAFRISIPFVGTKDVTDVEIQIVEESNE